MRRLPRAYALYPGLGTWRATRRDTGDFIGWFAVVAPTGTPVEVIQRMNREVDAALRDVEIAKRMRDVGMYAEGGTPEQAAAYLRTQLEQWGKIIHEIVLQPE